MYWSLGGGAAKQHLAGVGHFDREIPRVVGRQRIAARKLDEALMQSAIQTAQVQIDPCRLVLPEGHGLLPALLGLSLAAVEIELDGLLRRRTDMGQFSLDRQRHALRNRVGRQPQRRNPRIVGLLDADVDDVPTDFRMILDLGRQRLAGGIGPGTAGQIGEDVNLFSLARALFQQPQRIDQRFGQRRANGRGRQPLDPLPGRAQIDGKHARAVAGIDDRHVALLGQLRQQPIGRRTSRFQPGLVLMAIFHPGLGVENHRRGDRRLAVADPARALEARPGQGQGQQQDDRYPQGQEQPMPQLQLPPVGAFAAADEAQGRKLQSPHFAPHHQMQHDRHGDQQGPPQEGRVEKRHLPHGTRFPCRRPPSSAGPPTSADHTHSNPPLAARFAADQIFGQRPVELHARVQAARSRRRPESTRGDSGRETPRTSAR